MLKDDDYIVLTKKEKGFLINCIMLSAEEHFRNNPRYKEKYHEESGIKYDKLEDKDIVDLIKKLSGDFDDLYEFFHYL